MTGNNIYKEKTGGNVVAIIPVAGIGSRLRPHTHTQPKALIPVAGKPIVAHIIDKLIAAGIQDFIFVVGYLGDKIEKYISTHYPDQHMRFVIQTSGKGIGHAIYLTKELAEEYNELLIVLGDTIFETQLDKVFASPYSTLGVKKVDDPRLFGVAELSQDKKIVRLIEKPPIPKSNLALIGVYFIRELDALFDALAYNIEHKIKTQGEYHLTDALMKMIDQGVVFKTFDVESWFDCGKKEVLLQTNKLLLKRYQQQDASIVGAGFDNTVIIPPVFIGQGVQISNSVIGPNVSIGDKAILHSCIVTETIIGPFAHLENAILKDTIVGNDAHLRGKIYTLNLGDSAEISFS